MINLVHGSCFLFLSFGVRWSDLQFLFLFCSTRTLWWACWSPAKSQEILITQLVLWFSFPLLSAAICCFHNTYALLFSWHGIRLAIWIVPWFLFFGLQCGYERGDFSILNVESKIVLIVYFVLLSAHFHNRTHWALVVKTEKRRRNLLWKTHPRFSREYEDAEKEWF